MDIITILVILFLLYIGICVYIVLFADSDILTFLYSKFGRGPSNAYNGKVIWITGASSGIGEAISKELAKYNTKLVLSARRSNELDRVKQLCLQINPSIREENILVLPFDMVDFSAHQASFQKVIDHFGQLDVLISNAGRSQRAQWHEIELDVDRELFDLNLFSLVNLNRIAVKHFLQSGGGQIVVNSSLAGILGMPYSASYTGSKHALQGYFKGLRNEVGMLNISVTLFLPGPTFSGFLSEAFTGESGKKFGKPVQASDKRMTAERCAVLAVVAMANEIEEAWIGIFPTVAMGYISTYLPYMWAKLEFFGRKYGYFMKVRDGRDTLNED